MPFTAYLDLLTATYREYLWVYEGVFKISDLPEFFLSGYLWLLKPIFSHLEPAINTLNSDGRLDGQSYNIFVNHFRAYRYLFLLKIPFLILDISMIFIIWNFFQDKKKRYRMFLAWGFFPFIIYATYLWGRYEIFPIFLTLLAYYFASKKNNYFSLITIGLAIAMKVSFILYLPFFIIFFSKNYRDYLVNTILAIFPVILFSKLFGLFGAESLSSGIERGGFFEFLVHGQIGEGFTAISITVAVYILTIFFYFRDNQKVESDCSFKEFVFYSGIMIISYFAFSKFHSHYVSWIAPVFFIIIAYNIKYFYYVLLLFVSWYLFIDNFFGISVTTGLYRPGNFSFFSNLGSFSSQMSYFGMGQETLSVVYRTLFVLLIGLIVFSLYKDKNEDY